MTNEAISVETVIPATLEDNLAFWEQCVDRLTIESPSLAGSNQYPEWYQDSIERIRDIVPQLQADGADLTQGSKYYELFAKESELRSKIIGYPQYNHPIQQLSYNLGEKLMAKMLNAESVDGAIHNAMLDDLSLTVKEAFGSLTPELNVLKEAYGLKSVTQLLGIGGDHYSDKLRSLLLQEMPIRWMRHLDEERTTDPKWHETQEAMRNWMSRAVEAATGMPTDEASDYVFSASRRGEDGAIIKIINKFDHFGIGRIRELAKTTGIHGLDAYSVEQLERMEEFIYKPAEVSLRLSVHDVNVILVNRFGDHNGVMTNVAADFDDESGRTLFFEITNIDDIYRRLIKLHKAGILPSTLLLAAHSAPGQFMVTDVREKDKNSQRRDIATVAGRKLVEMVYSGDDHDPGDYGFSMHGMKGLARIVETYMQPSRGIDDDELDAGRKKVIFQACHAASEVQVADLDDNQDKLQIGMESVVSQLGKDLIASGVKSSIDIYGAAGTIQMHRNEHGVHYSGQPTSFNNALEGRPHMNAERIRVENGKLTKQEVEDIVLRKKV